MDDIKRILTDLETYPDRILQAQLEVETAREALDLDKIRREYSYAGLYMKSKANGYTDTQCKMEAALASFEGDMAIVKSESTYRKALAQLTYLDNKFAACRKSANIQEAILMKTGGLV